MEKARAPILPSAIDGHPYLFFCSVFIMIAGVAAGVTTGVGTFSGEHAAGLEHILAVPAGTDVSLLPSALRALLVWLLMFCSALCARRTKPLAVVCLALLLVKSCLAGFALSALLLSFDTPGIAVMTVCVLVFGSAGLYSTLLCMTSQRDALRSFGLLCFAIVGEGIVMPIAASLLLVPPAL